MRAVVQKFHNFCLKSRHLPSLWSRKRSNLPEKSIESASTTTSSKVQSPLNKLELVHLEFELLNYLDPDGAPKQLNEKMIARLCEQPILKNRILYMLRCRRNEEKARLKKEKLAGLPAFRERIREERDQQIISYNMFRNTIFLRFWQQYISRTYQSRYLSVIKDRPVICIDFFGTNSLLSGPLSRLITDLEKAIHVNQRHRTPCKLVLTNFGKGAPCWSKFGRISELELNEEEKNKMVFSVESTEKSILELYPDRKKIYLAPKSFKPLMNFDEDVVYILGGLPTREGDHGASLDRAAALGIEARCLPINEHILSWPDGLCKSLPLDQCLGTLLDYYHHQNWKKSITDRALSNQKTPKSKTADNMDVGDCSDHVLSKRHLVCLESQIASYFG